MFAALVVRPHVRSWRNRDLPHGTWDVRLPGMPQPVSKTGLGAKQTSNLLASIPGSSTAKAGRPCRSPAVLGRARYRLRACEMSGVHGLNARLKSMAPVIAGCMDWDGSYNAGVEGEALGRSAMVWARSGSHRVGQTIWMVAAICRTTRQDQVGLLDSATFRSGSSVGGERGRERAPQRLK